MPFIFCLSFKNYKVSDDSFLGAVWKVKKQERCEEIRRGFLRIRRIFTDFLKNISANPLNPRSSVSNFLLLTQILKMRLLLVEDDERIARFVAKGLREMRMPLMSRRTAKMRFIKLKSTLTI